MKFKTLFKKSFFLNFLIIYYFLKICFLKSYLKYIYSKIYIILYEILFLLISYKSIFIFHKIMKFQKFKKLEKLRNLRIFYIFKGRFTNVFLYFKGALSELLFKTRKVIYKFIYLITTIFIYRHAYYICEIKINGG